MYNLVKVTFATIALGLMPLIQVQAQSLGGALKDRIKKEAGKAFESPTKPSGNNQQNDRDNSDDDDDDRPSNAGGKPVNRGGGGLIVSPPDVRSNIDAAEAAFRGNRYAESRNAIRQAMIGVEMEIGQTVLDNLPNTIDQLAKVQGTDKVTSTGAGWVGLTIQRSYQKGEKQLNFMVANNSALMAATNMYLSNASYTASSDQQWKQVTLQGNRGILEYSDYSGYKLSVPMGQSSLFTLEGINFQSEQDIMSAANKFDLAAIKSQLGEK